MILVLFKATIVSLFLIGNKAFAATVLTDVDGQTVKAISSEGKSIVLKEGQEVGDGTIITVAPAQSVTLATDTGMEVFVGQNSQIKVDSDEEPLFKLLQGEIRSFLSDSKDKEKRPRMRIQTRDAVVGVRGTDFVVSTNDQGTDLKTLEGEVVVAKTQKELKSGTITSVGQGEAINQMHSGQSYTKEKFNRDEFLKAFASRHPRIAALKERAASRRQMYRESIAKKRAARRERREKLKEELKEQRQQHRRSRQSQ